MELTSIQKEILIVLINLHRKKGGAVKAEDIAKSINRNPGTIRNQMQALRTLELIKGVPGPKGGYRADSKAYEVLAIGPIEDEAAVPVHRNKELVDGITVQEINLTSVRHPILCKAALKMLGNIKEFEVEDNIEIGPTPVNKMVIKGTIEGRDDTENILLCEITEMISLPKGYVIDHMDIPLIAIPQDASLQETARILLDSDIRCAPLMMGDEVVGIASFKDISKALAQGDIGAKVEKYARKDVVSIEGDQPLSEAVRLVNEHGIGSVLVTSNGKPQGLITKSKLMSGLVVY